MKKIVLESFKNTLKEIKVLTEVIKKEKPRKEELLIALKSARQLLFSSYSSLNIFDESVKNYISVGHKVLIFKKIEKKKINKTEVKLIYNNLLSLLSSEIDNNIINPRTKIHAEREFLYIGFTLYSAKVNEEIDEFNKSLTIVNLKKEEVKNILLKYYKEIIQFVEDILLYDILMIFDKPEVTYKNEYKSLRSKDYKKEYLQKWLDGSVEYIDMHRYRRIDHWSEIFKLDLSSDKLEELEKLQIKFFDKTIKNKVASEIENINQLENQNKLELVKSHIELIESFFKGDTSKVVTKRLKNIFDFIKPKEVLLEYDNLLLDRLILSDFVIYEVGSSRFSKTFTASFFMVYLKELKKNHINITNSVSNKSGDTFRTLITNKSKREYIYNILEHFGAINSKRKSVLTTRKKGVLRGVVEALMDSNILPQSGLHNLCLLIAKDINLDLPSKLDYHDTAKKIHREANQYIKDNPFH